MTPATTPDSTPAQQASLAGAHGSAAVTRHADELQRAHGFDRIICERMAFGRALAEALTLAEAWREKLVAETKLHNATAARLRLLEAEPPNDKLSDGT